MRFQLFQELSQNVFGEFRDYGLDNDQIIVKFHGAGFVELMFETFNYIKSPIDEDLTLVHLALG